MGEKFSVTDHFGVTLYGQRFPVANPRAVIQLLHGLGEHSGRYGWLTERLNAAGYTVYRFDQRGHGKTGVVQHSGHLDRLGKLGPGGMPAVIEDVQLIREFIELKDPGLPIILFGHSWGSLSSQILWNTDSELYAGLVLSGTAYRTPKYMYGGNLNSRHKHLGDTGAEWLSRDPQVAEDFRKDPLTFDANVLKLFGPIDGLRLFGLPAKELSNRPILIQVGSDDTLGGTKSAERLKQSYQKRAGVTDVTLHVYPDARHEIYNEINKQDVLNDLLNWLEENNSNDDIQR